MEATPEVKQPTNNNDSEPVVNPAEQWRAVPDYVGFYEVSSLGRVRSLPRTTASGLLGGRLVR